eukprot:GFUD01033858.1.p1 GENE.GFUD01033858.1~~GFUD01033858.1.p1  ORF type:complete len:654 (-),score=109.54 GFUD01033858.1:582-2510(-)
MGVVVGSEVDKEDAILIPDKECDQDIMKKNKFSVFTGVSLMLIGAIIFVITVLILITAYFSWSERAPFVLCIIIGIFMFFHGLIVYFQPPKIYSLEVVINGKQSSSILPLRQILVCMTNISCGITGIITMCTIGTGWYGWQAGSIVGLVLSILLLLVTCISVLAFYFKTSKLINSHILNYSGTDIKETAAITRELISKQVEIFSNLLPLPSVQSLNNLDNVLKQPRLLTNKPVLVMSILLAMVACIAMFSAQLWDIAISECDEERTCTFNQDPADTFARTVLYGIVGYRVSDRKIIILVSTPIAFLLCTTLLLLMRGTTVLRMVLSGLISLGMGIFFFLYSLDTVQYIILLGAKLSNLSFILKLVSMMPIPLLAALFVAFAYSNIIHSMEEKKDDKSSKVKTGLLIISIILSILFFFLSLATMTTSNLVIMSTVQGHWNTTKEHTWDVECRDNNHFRYDDYGYGYRYDTTTTSTPESKPDKCYGKALDWLVQDNFTLFSICHLLMTESFLLLSVFVSMNGRRITKKTLFLPGLLLFAAATSSIISFFSGIVQYDIQTNGFPFFIMNSINTLSALVIGFIFVITGGSVFISFLIIVFRIILSILVFSLILIMTTFDALLKLATLTCKTPKPCNVEEQPAVATA